MESLERARHRLPFVLIGHGFMRIGGGTGGVLVGLYLLQLAEAGQTSMQQSLGRLAQSFSRRSQPAHCRWECSQCERALNAGLFDRWSPTGTGPRGRKKYETQPVVFSFEKGVGGPAGSEKAAKRRT
jgi:hypothetical protein